MSTPTVGVITEQGFPAGVGLGFSPVDEESVDTDIQHDENK